MKEDHWFMVAIFAVFMIFVYSCIDLYFNRELRRLELQAKEASMITQQKLAETLDMAIKAKLEMEARR